MHITVLCPKCANRYQLQPEMLGKRMRCVNPLCREIFEVRAADTPVPKEANVPAKESPPPAKKDYAEGFIGDVVPFVTSAAAEEPPSVSQGIPRVAAEIVRPSEPDLPPMQQVALPPAEIAWQQAPPERRSSGPASREPTPTSPKGEAPAEPASRGMSGSAGASPSLPQANRGMSGSAGASPSLPQANRGMSGSAGASPSLPQANRGMSGSAGASPSLPPTKKDEPKKEPAPRELPPGAWVAPPVRRPTVSPAAAEETLPSGSIAVPAPVTKRFGKYFIALCFLLIGGVAWLVIQNQIADPEAELRQVAEQNYDEGDYRAAAEHYGKLIRNFGDSEHHAVYEFRRELSLLLAEAGSAVFDPDRLMKDLQKFLQEQQTDAKKKSLLEPSKAKIWELFRAMIDRALEDAEKNVSETKLNQAKRWIDDGKAYWPAPATPPYSERNAKLRHAIDQQERRQLVQGKLSDLLKGRPTLKDVQTAEEVVRAEKLDGDPAMRKLLIELVQKAVPSIEYVRGTPLPVPREYSPPGALVGPLVESQGGPLPGTGVFFALARGVLYALRESDGAIQWATRVGVDTTQLPVRLSATPISPETVLVLSSDTNTLRARRVADGAALWQHALGQPCLGRPLIVQRDIPQADGAPRRSRRAYVPTVDGRVQEIEMVSGGLLGEYRCGLPLRIGGARQPGSNLVYFPADHGFVFVLDLAKQNCLTVLRTGHPSGSLRSAPIVVAGEHTNPEAAPAPPRYFILCQTQGLEGMKLRTWELSSGWPSFDSKPPLEQTLRGWSWYAPLADSEKIVLATDAGVLGLFGINQPNNRDPPLFPLLGKNREIQLGITGSASGQAQVVHAAGNDCWTLAGGELQLWRTGFDPALGLRLSPIWRQSVTLGSPLNAGQVNATGDILCVVTQPADRSTCLASAVEAATGRIRWQRQLGLVCAADPIPLGPQVLAPERTGSLYLFDSTANPPQTSLEWQFVQEDMLAKPALTATGASQFVQSASDGAIFLMNALTKNKLRVRRYAPAKKPKSPGDMQEWTFHVALGGTPAVGAGQLVVPLPNGSLQRWPLAKGAPADYGQEWRADQADAGAVGHVVYLGGDDFLCTDGSHGLQRFSWPLGQLWQKKELQLPALERIVAVPLVVPTADGKGPPRVCIADSAGTLTLLQGDTLSAVRSWKLSGTVSAGPFLRGRHIGCVIDRGRLVWIDPDQAAPLWTYEDSQAGPIVGQPQQLGERIVLAHAHGKLVSLTRAQGQVRGRGHTIRAHVAPAAAPVGFGPDRIFVPLTDGTILLLPLEDLEVP